MHKYAGEWNLASTSMMVSWVARRSRNLFSICDYSGHLSWDGLHQTQAAVQHCGHYYHYQKPCRRPADKPSALHVEIDGASDPLCVRHDVFKGPKAARVQKEVKSDEGKEAVRAGEEQSSNIYLKERGLAGGILWDRTLGRCIDNHWELCSCCVLYSAVHPVSSASRWMLRMIEVSLL